MNNSFHKEEKLCSKIAIETLLKEGYKHFCFPLKIVWNKNKVSPGTNIAQVAFAVPKRNFKRANKRNLIKRRLRECYRINKHPLLNLLEERELFVNILFVYISTEILTYQEIEPKLKNVLNHIMEEIKKSSN